MRLGVDHQAYHPHHELAARLQVEWCLDKGERAERKDLWRLLVGLSLLFCRERGGAFCRHGWAVNGVLGPW